MTEQTVTARTLSYQTAYALVDGKIVALMERSPWTGEWCYGLSVTTNGRFAHFQPPFKPTRRKTAKAAAKVVAATLA